MVGRGCFSSLVEKLLATEANCCEMVESCNGNFGLKTTFAQTEPYMGTEKCRHPHFEMIPCISQGWICMHAYFANTFKSSQGLSAFSSLLCSNAYHLCIHPHCSTITYPTQNTTFTWLLQRWQAEGNIRFVVPFIYASRFNLICAPTRDWSHNLGI